MNRRNPFAKLNRLPRISELAAGAVRVVNARQQQVWCHCDGCSWQSSGPWALDRAAQHAYSFGGPGSDHRVSVELTTWFQMVARAEPLPPPEWPSGTAREG